MAHVRREFFAFYESTKLPVAGEAVLRFKKLYDVETQARFLPAYERVALRQEHATPIFDSLEVWLKEQLGQISGKTPSKPSDMRLRACQRHGPISITAFLSLTTTRPSAQSALWPLDVRTICLWGQRQAVNPPLSPTLSIRPPK